MLWPDITLCGLNTEVTELPRSNISSKNQSRYSTSIQQPFFVQEQKNSLEAYCTPGGGTR